MGTRIRNGSSSLAAAMTLLVQTQAQFVNDRAEMRKDFAAICGELEAIKAVLARHEKTLQRLPEVIRQKIGFKGE